MEELTTTEDPGGKFEFNGTCIEGEGEAARRFLMRVELNIQ